MLISIKRISYICLAQIILLNNNIFIKQADGILNCFTPNMFKMGKVGHPPNFAQQQPAPFAYVGGAGGGGGGERTHWYGGGQQHNVMAFPPYGYQMAGSYGAQHHNPMKMLFQPKWKGGSLFGSKGSGGWNNWKLGGGAVGLNSNFYRPNYAASYAPMAVQSPNGYQFNEQLNVAPFSLPSPINPYASAISNYNQQYNLQQQQHQPTTTTSYSNNNDGWSVPFMNNYNNNQQQTNYDTSGYTQQQQQQQLSQPLIQPQQQQQQSGGIKQPLVDPYSTKGGNVVNNKLTSTTKSNILLADGGYGTFDSYLMNLNNYNNNYYNKNNYNKTFGYTYPTNWYSMQQYQQQQNNFDSPAKIAQQLLKYNLKKLRLQEQPNHYNNQEFNKSAPLIETNIDDVNNSVININNQNSQFTILDEPRFVGFGTVEELNNKEAKLSCSFNEAIDQTNRPLWTKFLGPYNSSQIVNGKNLPPFNCANSQCRTQEIESTTKDYRFKFDNGPATSTLIISEPRLSDYGIYRCSALTKTLNNNPLETIYQIIRFGSLK